jgi:hypothetical protein
MIRPARLTFSISQPLRTTCGPAKSAIFDEGQRGELTQLLNELDSGPQCVSDFFIEKLRERHLDFEDQQVSTGLDITGDVLVYFLQHEDDHRSRCFDVLLAHIRLKSETGAGRIPPSSPESEGHDT